MIFSPKNLDIKKTDELGVLNPILRCCQGTIRGYESDGQV